VSNVRFTNVRFHFGGMVSGFVPSELGMSNAYSENPWANGTISIARDAARGYMIDGADGAKRNMAWGMGNNLVGHAMGLAFSGGRPPSFRDGMWIYSANIPGTPAITLGNVVSMNPDLVLGLSRGVSGSTLTLSHEREHATLQAALGMAYLPTHMASQWGAGSIAGRQWSFMEQRPFLNQLPYGERLGTFHGGD
jgi:hypothetical protein